jgi:radical SAM protein with 4Fe4S-binding SPASM domain
MSNYLQHSPFAVQLEMVEGCNLRCDFCGIQGIRTKAGGPYKVMTNDTLVHILDGIKEHKWNPRIELAMHGEPTMHPNLPYMIAIIRKWLPDAYIMLTTNGGGLLPNADGKLAQLFMEGVNVVALDCYEHVNISEKVRTALKLGCLAGVEFHEYPAEKDFSPHTRRKGKHLIFVKDISKAADGTHSRLNNHCGSAAPKNYEMQDKRCAKPFREMAFRWDGSVALCCEDWRGEFKVGNVNEKSVGELWLSEAMNAARRILIKGWRGHMPTCSGCDQRSYRVGLLPDPLGKITLPDPTDNDIELVRTACSGPSLTLPVLRPWEV